MTVDEINALVALLQRTPMTPAELLWVQTLVARLQQAAAQQQAAAVQRDAPA